MATFAVVLTAFAVPGLDAVAGAKPSWKEDAGTDGTKGGGKPTTTTSTTSTTSTTVAEDDTTTGDDTTGSTGTGGGSDTGETTGGAVVTGALYVSTTGSDTNSGTAEAPFATVGYGLRQLGPGDTLYVRGGVYAERIKNPTITAGTADAPILVAAYPGERPVIQGLLWLKGASYWTIDGINVTWSDANFSSEHMVKMTNGVGWTVKNSEFWDARSAAALLVAGTVTGEPAGWRVTGNCVHDTHHTHKTNQDHLIYANTGLTAGTGVIERNLLFRALNGEGVKLGGPSSTSGGTVNVTVRHNTIYDTAQSVLIAWSSHDNTLTGNLMAKTGGKYANVRGYQLSGERNVATSNLGLALSAGLILNDAGYVGVADAGDNLFPVDPLFDSTTDCTGFHPQNPLAAPYGRYAP